MIPETNIRASQETARASETRKTDEDTGADLGKNPVTVRIICDPDYIPVYTSPHASGADLRAAIEKPVSLSPGKRSSIPTGISLEIPTGFEGQVRGRSGLARNYGIGIVNAPGTIDSDYRGEIQVLLVNFSDQTYTVQPGDRIAQLVIAPVVQAQFVQTNNLSASTRGNKGFGTSGKR